MSGDTETVRELQRLPWPDRAGALADLVVAQFREALLMSEDEELGLEESFFDLGLTSLRLTELKQRLETLLGRPISANALFNRPTVSSLMDHLSQVVLADLFGREPAAPGPGRN